MQPIKHPNETLVIGKPRNWDEERDGPCGGLSVEVAQHGALPAFRSRWKPDEGDLVALNAGGSVEIQIIGQQAHPVISLIAVEKEGE